MDWRDYISCAQRSNPLSVQLSGTYRLLRPGRVTIALARHEPSRSLRDLLRELRQ